MKRFLLLALLLVANLLRAATSETALHRYIHNQDDSFRWEVIDSTQHYDLRAYRLHLTSQTWRGIPWYHEMVVIIPRKVKHREALIHLTGGSEDEKTGKIKYHDWKDETIQNLGRIAHNCQAVTAIVWQVPRQPLYGGKKEDALVSYTFHQFQQSGDDSWPLLLPMTKTAIRAMDAISQFTASRKTKKRVNRFVINGISKRGWTTWLTAAAEDSRVVAIAPMVIDMLNMPSNLSYQKLVYGQYSAEINDYVSLGLTETASRPEGKALVEIVDPYSYRNRLTQPKMLFMGTNDEYWTADAVKHYIDGIPGTNMITYVPNAGHSLGDGQAAILSLEAFFCQTLKGCRYNTCQSSVKIIGEEADLFVQTKGKGRLLNIELWEANSQTRDFRSSHFECVKQMRPEGPDFHITASLPPYAYKAFFVMLTYEHPVEKKPYTICTRMYTADNSEVFSNHRQP